MLWDRRDSRGDGGRSSSSGATRDRTQACTAASAGDVVSGASRSIAWHAHSSSIAMTSRARVSDRAAFSDAAMLMLTWSSLFADVGIESTPAGCCPQSGCDGGGGDLRQHPHRSQPALARQERRQAAQGRIHEAIGAPFADRRQWRQRRSREVGGDGDRRAVEVAAGDDVAGVGEHHRVVGRGVGLDLSERRARASDRLARGAVHLGRAAQRVGVLHAPAVLACDRLNRAVVEQAREVAETVWPETAAPRECAPRTGESIRAARRSTARRRCRPRARAVRRPPAPARAPRSTAACR